eukprot:CAMPEP_0185170088 /NCGR_PEP_ID=MMETSP1139-20130426/18188_1 /TAXON_ID=298111 /ORGANISM="Pavlova sp., Strain CCMP459" /LENGTH=108 /DNA_ID=CAMNT_0027735639 /DNA_START=119 /DNA_END=445 /DNA_ORIENTATION=-
MAQQAQKLWAGVRVLEEGNLLAIMRLHKCLNGFYCHKQALRPHQHRGQEAQSPARHTPRGEESSMLGIVHHELENGQMPLLRLHVLPGKVLSPSLELKPHCSAQGQRR